MTKSELLADLAGRLGDGFLLETTLVETVDSEDASRELKRYYVNVANTGADVGDGEPTAQKRTLEFYVYDEGAAGEAAYWKDRSWINPEAAGGFGATLAGKGAIYANEELRGRVGAAVIGAAYDVLNELETVDNHAARVELAGEVMRDSGTYLLAFMFFVTVNATVQAAGAGGATDNDLQFIVNSEWDTVAEAVGLIAT